MYSTFSTYSYPIHKITLTIPRGMAHCRCQSQSRALLPAQTVLGKVAFHIKVCVQLEVLRRLQETKALNLYPSISC